jgi:hypothetical protein
LSREGESRAVFIIRLHRSDGGTVWRRAESGDHGRGTNGHARVYTPKDYALNAIIADSVALIDRAGQAAA